MGHAWADGLAGQLWAATLLIAWWTWARLATAIPPFRSWSSVERAALTYAVAMAGFSASTLLLGRLFGLGYYGGASSSAVLAIAISVILRRRKSPWEIPDLVEANSANREVTLSWWILLAVGSLPAGLIAVFTHSVDLGVHFWNMKAIQRDLIPLPYPSYPSMEVPYHYAIDLVAATWGRLIPVDPEWIFDGLSVCAFFVCTILAARLTQTLRPMSKLRALGYVLAFAFLGGGLMWALFPIAENSGALRIQRVGLPPWLFTAGLFGHFSVLKGVLVNLPTLHYFFNMPVAAGLPMGLAFLHVYPTWVNGRNPTAFGLSLILLAALASAHVSIFLVLGLSIGLFAIGLSAKAIGQRRPILVGTLLLGVGAAALAPLQGGFFASLTGTSSAGPLLFFDGLGVGPIDSMVYYAAVFGVPAALGIVGGLAGLRNRSHTALLLVLISVIGFCTPHVVWATASPIDNFKFFTLAAIALGILAGPAVESLLSRTPAVARPALVFILVAASITTPLLHAAARVITAPSYMASLQARKDYSQLRLQPLLSDLYPGEFAASQWLRTEMDERDLLLLIPANPPFRRPGTKYPDATDLHVHAMVGGFVAAPSYPGYPGIALPPALRGPRARLVGLASSLDPRGLCGLAPLWIYVRESLLPAASVRAIQAATLDGRLREARVWSAPGRRHIIYEACPGWRISQTAPGAAGR